MVHDLSPFIIRFTDTLGLRWYGFAYLLGFFVAGLLMKWLAERQRAGLKPEMVSDFVVYGAFGAMIGGRLGYCLFYDPTLFWTTSWSFPFWKVLAVNEGGMASHGGFIGVIVASWLYGRKHNINWVYLVDLITVVGPWGLLFGRIANFINGELVGRVAPETFKYGVRFPQDILNWPQYEFDRLKTLSSLTDQVGLSGSQWDELLSAFPSSDTARDQVYEVLNKIIFGIQNGNANLKQAISPLLDYRYPSQLIAGFTEGIVIFILMIFLSRKSRRPGFLTGSAIMAYAVMRIFNEQFRMPDIQIGYQLLGLTRGQWLSVAMFMVGFVLLVYWSRTQSQVVHGWLRGEDVKLGGRRKSF